MCIVCCSITEQIILPWYLKMASDLALLFSLYLPALGTPAMSTTATATISIMDVNDNSPVLVQSQYSFELRENDNQTQDLFTVCLDITHTQTLAIYSPHVHATVTLKTLEHYDFGLLCTLLLRVSSFLLLHHCLLLHHRTNHSVSSAVSPPHLSLSFPILPSGVSH